MKLFRSSLVLILSTASTLPLLASRSPIAPLPPRLGDLAYNDQSARSARGGDSVLVVWENEPTIYPETGSVYGRVLGPGHEASTSFLIRRSATSPAVSWSGKSWVVGYGIANSRFNPYPYDNVVVRTVSPDGTLGAEHVLNRSADDYPTLTDIVWTGTSWLVVFEHRRIAFLDENLDPIAPVVDLDPYASSEKLVTINGRWYLIRIGDDFLAATEIEKRGIGKTFRSSMPEGIDAANAMVFATGARVVLVSQSDVFAGSFSPDEGWSVFSEVIHDSQVFDVAAYGDGVLLLHGAALSEEGRRPLRATLIDGSGAVVSETTLLSDEPFLTAAVGEDASGAPTLLLSTSRDARTRRDTGTAILSLPLDSLRNLDAERPELISVTNFATQSQPLIASAGSYAVAFWNQTIDDDGNVAAFSRRIDASGGFLSDPVRLPFAIGLRPQIDVAAGQFLLGWDETVITVSADGQTAGTLSHIPEATALDVAAGDDGGFAVWSDRAQQLMGTPLRADGSLVVPMGFPLLPSLRPQTHAAVARAGDHFRILWWENDLLGAATATPGGTVSDLSSTDSAEPDEIEFAGNDQNSLAVWTTYQKDLVDLGFPLTAGTVGVDVRRVGAERAAVAPDEAGFKVAFSGGERIWTSDVTMQSAFVTGFSTPQYLTRGAPQGDLGLTVVNGSPLVVWDEDHRVWLGDARPDGRRRPLD